MKLSQLKLDSAKTLVGGDAEFFCVSTDTRSLQPGDLFVALRGEHFDGHAYIAQAIEKGACAVVVDTVQAEIAVPQWVVKDTVRALGFIAANKRAEFEGAVVGLTGSSGKTSVKGMLEAVCRQAGPTVATAGNLNNHIGVPQTLMRLEQQAFAIVEAGTSGFGEIAYLTSLIQPEVALVNNVMPAHMAGFGSLDAIAQEKGDIYGGSNLRCAVINLDDNYAQEFLARNGGITTIGFTASPIQYEKNSGVDTLIYGECLTPDGMGCYSFDLVLEGNRFPVNLQVPGKHSVNNALAAASCAVALGVAHELIAKGVSQFQGVAGRMQRVSTKCCHTLINDTYNANPGSMRAAANYLAHAKHSVMVVGDMGELGSDELAQHFDLGRYAKSQKIKNLFAVGELSKQTVAGFGEGATWFEDKVALASALQQQDLSDAVVLVKGSRSAKMEEVIELLVKNDEVSQC
ncbi:UDP-N-acetylmuramoyl-tripeptide--D-alanyl-D-alanine ligase [Teredinibacter turnerae T7901]|uniref:UDP-N-acetylmuramoyl-tripeptide--D-alanyl-D-alanine ligase n=1 Tax=Teredinibacter turnerae (strain ATCC 39867 / T7901) TaxID=377629 RepID=C5BP38_TERTT|nr:UDP-N-acetylmuramoyl-tripeptide--D-alanyl-D-alanine ligase [Teredinibacter turnerae]ACR10967.1 UDP-N-acetylmuramoyl-tripeptide--D-alanyl-D-alanine ligase [Teredinibacter turnerae T7901]